MKLFRPLLALGGLLAFLVLITPIAHAGMFQYPSASNPLTGAETIPADTNLSGGQYPQTEVITVSQLQTLRLQALTDGATISSNAGTGTLFTVTLGGNRTIANPTNQVSAQVIRYLIAQDATGSRTVTWGSDFKWMGYGSAPTLSTTGGRGDLITCIVMDHLLCSAQTGVTF